MLMADIDLQFSFFVVFVRFGIRLILVSQSESKVYLLFYFLEEII